MESDTWVRRLELRHARICGALGYPGGGRFFDANLDAALDVQSRIERELCPWAPGLERERETSAARMAAEWERRFGRADDPETKRKIRATVEFLHRNAAAARERGAFGGKE